MRTPVPLTDLDAMLKRLHMPTIRRLYGELALRAEQEGMAYRTYLRSWWRRRSRTAQTRITRSVRKAKFPFLCTIALPISCGRRRRPAASSAR